MEKDKRLAGSWRARLDARQHLQNGEKEGGRGGEIG